MLVPNRHEASESYRYGYQGSEKDNEIKGEGNDYITHYRHLDPRIGKWISIDPKQRAFESPYVSMGNNPIIYNDYAGDTLRGMSNKSAQRTLAIIKETFSDKKFNKFNKLLGIEKDGKSFKQISEADYKNAITGLSVDEKALTEGYYHTITNANVHKVSVVDANQVIGSENATEINAAGGLTATGAPFKDTDIGSIVDQAFGGGANMGTTYGDLTVIVRNSSVKIPDFKNSKTGTALTSFASLERELLAHELLGHGLGRFTGSSTSGHEDAVQLSNLYLRVKGVNSRYRDGSSHGTGVVIPQATAESIPVYLQSVK